MEIKVLLFDIGGVLVKLTGAKRILELMNHSCTYDELYDRWIRSEYIRLFETGRCGVTEFAQGAVRELGMDIAPEAFIDEFRLFTRDFYPGACTLLRRLKPRYTLACLSNTSSLQWNSLCERKEINNYFHTCFLSHEIGMLKPDPLIYRQAIDDLGVDPAQIAFFDDTGENVCGAKAAGINAFKTAGIDELINTITDLGLLPGNAD